MPVASNYGLLWLIYGLLFLTVACKDSKTLEYRFGVINAGRPSFLWFGIKSRSYSNFLASTVLGGSADRVTANHWAYNLLRIEVTYIRPVRETINGVVGPVVCTWKASGP